MGRTFIPIGTIALVLLCVGCANHHPANKTNNPDIWQSIPSLPVGNGGFIAGFADDKLLVIGGTTWIDGHKFWLADTRVLPNHSNQWETTHPLPTPIAYAAFASNKHGVYWLGGSDGTDTWDDYYRITNGSAVEHVAQTGHKVVYAGAAADDESLYIVAGAENVSDLTSLSNRFLCVSLETGEASVLPPYPGGAVMLPAVVCTGGEILVFGGAKYDATRSQVVNVAESYAYSIQHKTWRKLAPAPYARRGMVACRLDADTILLGGGYGGINNQPEEDFADDTATYHLKDDRYLPAIDLPYAAMGQSLINYRGTLYLMGGEDRPRSRTSECYSCRISQ